ncbi:MAG: hypothetical protein IJS60_03600 [Abditibacteriota bacterium]|nr:hypothetical protein [Abditibacteriota bacterium]
MRTITSICLQLMEHEKKATLDSVAKVLEVAPGIVFSGKPKNNPLYSWVVDNEKAASTSTKSAKASKSKSKDKGDAKNAEDTVAITSSQAKDKEEVYKELEKWLDNPENKSHASS